MGCHRRSFRELEFRSLLQRIAPPSPARLQPDIRHASLPQLEPVLARIGRRGGEFSLVGSEDNPGGEILGCALVLPREIYIIFPHSLWQEVRAPRQLEK